MSLAVSPIPMFLLNPLKTLPTKLFIIRYAVIFNQMLTGIELLQSQADRLDRQVKALWNSFVLGDSQTARRIYAQIQQIPFLQKQEPQQLLLEEPVAKQSDHLNQRLESHKNRKRKWRQRHCETCINNDNLNLQNVLSASGKCFLQIMRCRPFKFQFRLVPFQHFRSQLEFDQTTAEEIRNYQKCIITAFNSKRLTPVFTELCDRVDDQFHTQIDCILLKNQHFHSAPTYFKNAFNQLGGDWATHPKFIEVPPGRNQLSKRIPKNFPYLYVDFGLNGGLVHVIEEPIDKGICLQVLAACADLQLMRRVQEQVETQWRREARRQWEGHDWIMLRSVR